MCRHVPSYPTRSLCVFSFQNEDDEIDEWDSDKDADVHPDDDAASGSWAFNDTE